VIAHDEEPAEEPAERAPPPAEAQQLPTNSVPISATSTFWRTVSSYGLNVSGPEQLRRLHALFDTLGEAAAVAENLQPKKTAPLATWPTAAEIAALAEEVRRLDDLVVGSAGSARSLRRRSGRARAASPPPPAEETEADERIAPLRIGGTSSIDLPAQVAVAPATATAKAHATISQPPAAQEAGAHSTRAPLALLERCERVANGDEAVAAVEAIEPAEEAVALRELLGALAKEHREVLRQLAARESKPAATAEALAAEQAKQAAAAAAREERELFAEELRAAAAREERELFAEELRTLTFQLQARARKALKQQCEAAATEAAARVAKEFQNQALVEAQEREEDVLRAAAGGGAEGGAAGSSGSSDIAAAAAVALLPTTATAEERAALLTQETHHAEQLAGDNDAAAIRGAAALIALPRLAARAEPVNEPAPSGGSGGRAGVTASGSGTKPQAIKVVITASPSTMGKPPSLTLQRAARRALELVRRPAPPNSLPALLGALARVAALDAPAALQAIEDGALLTLHAAITVLPPAPYTHAVQAAACCALGELIDAARQAGSGALATGRQAPVLLPLQLGQALASLQSEGEGSSAEGAAAASPAPLAERLQAALLLAAGLHSTGNPGSISGSISGSIAADAGSKGVVVGTKSAGARVAEAAAAAALAALLRAKPEGAARVPGSAVVTLIGRILRDGGGGSVEADRDRSDEAAAGALSWAAGSPSPRVAAAVGGALLGELVLAEALRNAGVDLGRTLRNTTGWTKLVGMLDAPPPNTATAAHKAALQLDRLVRAEPAGTSESAAARAATAFAFGEGVAGLGASAVAGRRGTLSGAVKALGGVNLLCTRICGHEKAPPKTLQLAAAPPRTLAALAGCLEVLVEHEGPAAQAEAVRSGVLPFIIKLISLARADLRRPGKGGINDIEPELLPNLVLAATALIRSGPPQLGTALREAGGIETLVSLLEMRTTGGPSELHVLALQALHAAGVNRPELIARAFGSYAARKGGGPSQAVEAAATVRAVRAIGIMTASLDPVEHPHADPRGA
jgi:hypothetical protein